MVVSASAAREVRRSPCRARRQTALRTVEGAGRDAMTELRHLLGRWRRRPTATTMSGPSGTAEVSGPHRAELVDSAPSSTGSLRRPPGRGADSRRTVRPPPPGIDVTAYRIVQEATNALKYGGGGRAAVTVRYADHSLRVEVLNSGTSVLSADRASTDAGPVSASAGTTVPGAV